MAASSSASQETHDLPSIASDNHQIPKVRKPYTISKQREKWTEEEHRKFLEALQLYGRGWRKIQEHIGTKTAVQIRSHAQKFFSKVSRDSCDGTEFSLKQIEIPPPRPKRKPVHPYPRKSIDVLEGIPVSNHGERSLSPSLSVVEMENQSPNSVLSAVVSDSFGSTISEQQNGYSSSPTSGVTDVYSGTVFPLEKEDHLTSNSSVEDDKGSSFSIGLNSVPVGDKLWPVKLELKSNRSVCTEGFAVAVPPQTTIKLFGRAVSVPVPKKHPFPGMENLSSATFKISKDDLDINNKTGAQATLNNQSDTILSLGISTDNLSSSSFSTPMSTKVERGNATCLETNTSFPWPSWKHPFSNGTPSDQSSLCEDDRWNSNKNEVVLDERDRDSNLDVDSQCQKLSEEGVTRLQKQAKGYVPHKRCLAETDIELAMRLSEKQERQRGRVCS